MCVCVCVVCVCVVCVCVCVVCVCVCLCVCALIGRMNPTTLCSDSCAARSSVSCCLRCDPFPDGQYTLGCVTLRKRDCCIFFVKSTTLPSSFFRIPPTYMYSRISSWFNEKSVERFQVSFRFDCTHFIVSSH